MDVLTYSDARNREPEFLTPSGASRQLPQKGSIFPHPI
ncbi:hypothetical protein BH11PSE1_BH11PSE1_25680 [soil metagenome]